MPTAVIRCTGVRVEMLFAAHECWDQKAAELAEEYDLSLESVEAALAYYQAHPEELDTLIHLGCSFDRGGVYSIFMENPNCNHKS